MSRTAIRIALVGADNLLGREIKDVLEAAHPKIAIESFASNGEANFGEEEGEAVYRQAVTAESLSGTDAVVLAGTAEGAAKARSAVSGPAAPTFIDCTGALDHDPGARIAAPLVEMDGNDASPWVVAHPAATMLASILAGLRRAGRVGRAVVQILQPASEQGKQGIGELQQQTTSLLSFKPLEKKVYDTQLSFAMVPAYGEESQLSLISIEQRVERHLATLLSKISQTGAPVTMPSLRVVQAPVFHGYTISGWFEFDGLPSVPEIEEALASSEVDVRSANHEPPTNVGVAGQSGVAVGDIRVDSNNSHAVWLWAVADNLRLVADSVRHIIDQMVGNK